MAKEDVERLKAAFEAYSREDFETAFQNVHPDFEMHDHMIPEDFTDEVGPDALLANRKQVLGAFTDLKYEALEFVDLEDRILVRVRGTATGLHTGIAVEEESGQIWAFRDGMAVRLDVYRTWRDARQAAGLEE